VDRSAKGAVVSDLLCGAPKYRRSLVEDLLFDRVRLPRHWLGPGDATVLALDPDALLDHDQARACAALTRHCLALIETVAECIELYVARERRRGARLQRAEVESLRRARGPRRVRDLLFESPSSWPVAIHEQFQDDVCQVLDEVRSEWAHAQKPLVPAKPDDSLSIEICKVTIEWAGVKGLHPDDAYALVSEVSAQLDRSISQGRPIADPRRWALRTARMKWTALASAKIRRYEEEPDVALDDVVGEQVAMRVDIQRGMRQAAAFLYEAAAAYLRSSPYLAADALAYRVAGDLLLTADVERITAIVQRTPDGIADVERELSRHGQHLEAGRQVAVIRFIRGALERTLSHEA
jgi:hypothetical protein